MSRKRQSIALPTDLIFDDRISSNAKVVFAVLMTFPKDKVRAGSAVAAPAVTVTHREVIEKSNLSQHTVVKSLARLKLTGWITQERIAGFANRYVLTLPVPESERIT